MGFIYSDVNSFTPWEKPQLTDIESVYQSLYNLFNVKKGERPWEPEYGVDDTDNLFGLMDDFGAFILLDVYSTAVNRWEPRVKLSNDSVVTAFPDEQRYEIDLVFEVVGIEGQSFKYSGSITK